MSERHTYAYGESILTNEKYKDDVLLKKSFSVDFLTKKRKHNEGVIPQYYVIGDHEAIIQQETFDLVQDMMTPRIGGKNRKSSVSVFPSRIKHDGCGSRYGSKVWLLPDKYKKPPDSAITNSAARSAKCPLSWRIKSKMLLS